MPLSVDLKRDIAGRVRDFCRTDLKRRLLDRSVTVTRVDLDTAEQLSTYVTVTEDGDVRTFVVTVREIKNS